MRMAVLLGLSLVRWRLCKHLKRQRSSIFSRCSKHCLKLQQLKLSIKVHNGAKRKAKRSLYSQVGSCWRLRFFVVMKAFFKACIKLANTEETPFSSLVEAHFDSNMANLRWAQQIDFAYRIEQFLRKSFRRCIRQGSRGCKSWIEKENKKVFRQAETCLVLLSKEEKSRGASIEVAFVRFLYAATTHSVICFADKDDEAKYVPKRIGFAHL